MSTIRERAGQRVTPLGVVGIILVPLVVAGMLIFALWNPQDRLENVTAAIVNNDEPVELNGQTVPLGRQLSGALVGGDAETNYTWVLTSEKDATAGLDAGNYVAVVTIPENFSKAATSFSGEADKAEQALIDVETSDKSRLVDDSLSQAITSTAATLMGRQLTTTYLDNVYVGFNTLNDQLGEAADGATALSEGAVSLADGAAQLGTGAGELATGASALADGAAALADGASQASTGASQFASGASTFASQLGTFTGGVTGVVGGITALDQQAAALPGAAQALAGSTSTAYTGSQALATALGSAAAALEQARAAECTSTPGSPECAQLTQAASDAAAAAGSSTATVTAAGTADGYAQALNSPTTGLPALAGGISQLAAGAAPLAAGAPQVAAGATTLASGASDLAGGIGDLAAGTQQLAEGTSELASGTGTFADGVTQFASGTTQLRDGTGALASGLTEATEQIPTYPKDDREQLAEVVADPVATNSALTVGFGANSLPLYAVLALWIGAFASFIVLSAMPARTLGSTRSSSLLALRAFTLPAIIGAIQGLLVAVILGSAQGLDAGDFTAFLGLSVLGGVTFAAVNQALLAWFGGFGRFLAMVTALIVLATGVISTAPAALDAIRGVLPVDPLISGMQSVLADLPGALPAVVGLVLWTLGSLVATTLAIARRRKVTVRGLALSAA